MLNFIKKLKLLKGQIGLWVKDKKDKDYILKKNLKKKIVDIDSLLDKGEANLAKLEDRLNALNNLYDLERMEALDLAQKAKIEWAIEGDENSKIFHGIINKHCNNLAICGILVDGQWIEDPLSVKNEFLTHFRDRFDSPCPDGFTFGFYRKIWCLLEEDVLAAVTQFFHHGYVQKGGNASFIALIPKSQGAKMVKDFRPISLSSLYKIIAKLLANHLVTVVGDLVNEVQSAFIANQQILDCPFILNELIHWCKARKKQSMIFKVDFEKAFDSVHWDFLDDILKNFGFGSRWRDWIQTCLNSSRGSILANGSPTSEFQFHKGLKHGYPLSPLLFILVMESLHLSFHKVVSAGLFKAPIQGLKKLESIRCHFLREVDPNVRKMTFVKWENVLASKEKGGLALHGNDGKLGSKPCCSSNWSEIINDIPRLYNKETNKSISVASKMAHPNLCFSLKRTPRGGTEQVQMEGLNTYLEGTFMSSMLDRWRWTLSGDGEFSVSSARRFIVDKTLETVGTKTRWNKYVPNKVNILA
ncbi:RNA-directed DNA polymerase, eukaryota [Tanacetum coccineum]